MGIEQNSLQQKFNKKIGLGERPFNPEAKNRLLTPEEWFAKYYVDKGKGNIDIPQSIIESITPEELATFKERYGKKIEPTSEQLEITN